MGYCGIDCKKCKNFVKPEDRDINDNSRKTIIRHIYCGWSIPSKDYRIECYGCEYDETIKENEVFDFCNKCKIRKCAIKKKVDSCINCDKFMCNNYAKKISRDFGRSLTEKERRNDKIKSLLDGEDNE